MLFTMQIGIFGFVPGVSDPDSIIMVMISVLGVGLLFLLLAFIAGFAHVIDNGGVIVGYENIGNLRQ